MKKNKLWIFLILIIPVLLIIGNTQKVKADSGFDTSYDSGGSSWSSSSSDWSSSDYSSSSSSSGGGILNLIVFIIIIVIVLFSNKKDGKKMLRQIVPNIVPINKIKEYIPNYDYNKFATDRFNDYVEIQNAWMNFDYDTLRNKLTDELYNQYAMQLDTMKIKNEQNIMNNYKLLRTYVTGIKEENGNIEITIQMVISLNDYIVKNGKVIRGSKNRLVTNYYEMKFVCSKESSLKTCPNCHAPLNNNASQKCEFCGSIITKNGENWVMTKKQTKRQW